jgi:hypothetical protein
MAEKTPTAEHAIRRANLLTLIGDEHGGMARFARAHNMSAAHLWQIRHSERGVGERLARKIEAAAGLDNGWLDRPHPASDIVVERFASQVATEASRRDVPPEMQDTILYLLRMAPVRVDTESDGG